MDWDAYRHSTDRQLWTSAISGWPGSMPTASRIGMSVFPNALKVFLRLKDLDDAGIAVLPETGVGHLPG